ncbi:inositol-3-phosphate synthase [Mycobacterium sp. MYCO198283]|uniref:inositol-3-phosphate synthase n=1 Tax=Mycobacterium sp. MYCO198283 TaxID=2883505 RepID=UPI001E40139C|nr:inositol-3-phosphate synthase [Mycobacterium sp. MYCO198283]MCG5431792.1 inositol-3-phosphate synthase [Mycobacterium sp. MYCO198283]
MSERLGVAVIGLGGAVATTAVAGIEMIRKGSSDLSGLPLADKQVDGLPDYRDIVFAGWDLSPDDLATAAMRHGVIGETQLKDGASALHEMRPWAAVGSRDFCANIEGANKIAADGHRAAVERIQADLAGFKRGNNLDRMVVLNLASTERKADADAEALQSVAAFERGLDSDDPAISPAMMYAYAAISQDTPYANFTPSVAADVKPLADLAAQRNVPVAGKDGKTGQTLLKTVIAPALRDRALHVDGWFSTNILGNSDGLALDDPKSLESKVGTKLSVLDQLLGYPVEDHIVMIHYYRPRGDDKEAWDNVDFTGFLGQKMQLKLNFLCKDSVLAAPLAIEIARCLTLAQQRGEGGVQEQLGVFFKSPQTRGGQPEHEFFAQQATLDAWLAAR